MVHQITVILALIFLGTVSFTMEESGEKPQGLRFKLYRVIGYPTVVPSSECGYDDVTGAEFNFMNYSDALWKTNYWGYPIYILSDGTFYDVATKLPFMYGRPSQKKNPLGQPEG
jgi:hypothetical protein